MIKCNYKDEDQTEKPQNHRPSFFSNNFFYIHILQIFSILDLKLRNTRLQTILGEKQLEITNLQQAASEEQDNSKVQGISTDEAGKKQLDPIENIDDCEREYKSYFRSDSTDSIQSTGDALFIDRLFLGDDDKVGWCLYHVKNNEINLIGAGPNHRGIKVETFLHDKYVLYSQGCGTECFYITAIDIYDSSFKKTVSFTPYFEFSNDNKWLISYHRQLYRGSYDNYKESDTEDAFSNYFMAEAVNLNTFEVIPFAPNPYFKKGEIVDYDLYSNYWIDLFNIDYDDGYNFLDEQSGIVAIPFKEQGSGKKTTRIFDINNNFREIKK